MGQLSKKEILEHLVDTALKKWGEEEVAAMRSSLERAAKAIWVVERFRLELEDKPVPRVDIHFEDGEE